MSNQRTEPGKVLHGEAEPPDMQAARVEALRACLREELPDLIREAVRSELEAQARREAVPQMLSREEAADALGISTRTLSTLTAAGEVPAVRVKGRVLYAAGTLRAYIRRAAGEGVA